MRTSYAAQSESELLDEASTHLQGGRLELAEDICRTVIDQDGGRAPAHLLLGAVLLARGDADTAAASFQQCLQQDPQNVDAGCYLAIALAEAGRLDEAAAADRAVLALEPRHAGALSHLTELGRFSHDAPELGALEAIARDDPSPQALFALAHAYERLGRPGEAFAWLRQANALKRASIQYDVSAELALLGRIADTFDAALIQRCSGSGSSSKVPILIVGMPRSGTTLVEQMLASHSRVHGAGELTHLMQTAGAVQMLNPACHPFPHGVAELPDAQIERLARTYVERLQRLAPDAARVCDKEPFNFRYLGWAYVLTPAACVIHCRRDPLDTCLSCFRSNFQSVPFSFDLEELGRYYAAYERLMDHWRRVLPDGWILEVEYEKLVEDFETESKRIVSHCDLAWEEACLDFHISKRGVKTQSFVQVRQPLYGHAVGRWHRYAEHLGPLQSALASGREDR